METESSTAAAVGAALWSGQLWFWVAAAFVWLRSVSGAYGVPRALIRAAQRGEPEAARFALDLARYRLGRGRLVPLGLGPFRWPFLGAALAYAIANAVNGSFGPLVAAALLGPVAAVDVALETRTLDKLGAARDAGGPAFAAFAEALGEALKLRTAATIGSVTLTAAALAAF